eukprot:m.58411 g.58411  ORF g.58411 m.58411 type:complete len:320 (-) comp7822_c1_seq2:1592-2551(-)
MRIYGSQLASYYGDKWQCIQNHAVRPNTHSLTPHRLVNIHTRHDHHHQGIGLEIVRFLTHGVMKLPAQSTVYLCSRDPKKGESALKEIKAEETDVDVQVAVLDITDKKTIDNLVSTIEAAGRGLDILINNAGFAFKNAATESMAEQAEKTLAINYYGTKAMSYAMLPLMNQDGRVVNVGSRAGVLSKFSPELQAKFLDPNLKEKDLDGLVEAFKAAAADGTYKEQGWPGTTYGVSKAAVHALTRIHARDVGTFTARTGITVNAICPGWCRTNMAGDKAPRSAADGADTPVWLATQTTYPPETGKFYGERQELDWVSANL